MDAVQATKPKAAAKPKATKPKAKTAAKPKKVRPTYQSNHGALHLLHACKRASLRGCSRQGANGVPKCCAHSSPCSPHQAVLTVLQGPA